jgi:hypothetical protein
MGDDYSMAQVYLGQIPPVEARALLIRAVVERLEARGFMQAPGEAPEHNRVIAIGPAENRPWLALYDSVSDPYMAQPTNWMRRVTF